MTAATAVHTFERVATGLPVQPLLDELAACPRLWDIDTRRQTYPGTNHADSRVILVQMPAKAYSKDPRVAARAWFHDLTIHPQGMDDEMPREANGVFHAAVDLAERLAVIAGAVAIKRIMIVELKAGGHVSAHVDTGPYADHTDRFHICLDNGATCDEGGVLSVIPEVDAPSFVGGRALTPDTRRIANGEAWWFNHKILHEAFNFGDRPRIHLIVDLVAPLYRQLRCDQPYSIQPELLAECWNEILPLCVRHKDEIAHYDDIDLNVDTDTYESLEQAGVVRLYTVRSLPDWQMIGYEVVMVSPNLHYQASKQAKVDVLYIAPEHRRGALGIKLVEYVDGMLRDDRVQVVYQHCKLAHPALGVVLRRLKYEQIETLWGKRLDR